MYVDRRSEVDIRVVGCAGSARFVSALVLKIGSFRVLTLSESARRVRCVITSLGIGGARK